MLIGGAVGVPDEQRAPGALPEVGPVVSRDAVDSGIGQCPKLNQQVPPPPHPQRRSASRRDPLTAMGVVDSNMLVDHDSRRKPFRRRRGGTATQLNGAIIGPAAFLLWRGRLWVWCSASADIPTKLRQRCEAADVAHHAKVCSRWSGTGQFRPPRKMARSGEVACTDRA
jgi:hypothetical protein